MDSFELNKLIGALLGVVFIIFSVSLLSDVIFASPAPEKPGYAIEAAEGGGEAAGAKEDAGPVDIRPMMASADPAKGEAIAKRCQACHSIEKGGPNKVGPDLWGVVGRPIASHEGFSYSAALKEFSEGGKKNWDFELISNFIHNPKKDVPGTAMGFAGLPKPEDRANVLAYLNQQSDNPLPMPKVEEKPADEAKADEGGGAKGGDAGQKADGGKAAPADKPEPVGKAAPAAKEQDDKAPSGDQQAAPADEKAEGNAAGQATDGKAPGNPTITVPGKEEGQPDAKPSDDAEHAGAPANAPAAKPDAATGDEPKAGVSDEPKVEKTPDAGTKAGATAPMQGEDSGSTSGNAPAAGSGSGSGDTPQTGSGQDPGSAPADSTSGSDAGSAADTAAKPDGSAPTTRQDEGPEAPVDNQ